MKNKLDLKELYESYKTGDSVQKLNIISALVTIITAVIALVTGQILTIRFSNIDITLIKISFYLITLAFSCVLVFALLWWFSFTIREIKSLLMRAFLILIGVAGFILLTTTLWGFVLSIQ